MCLLLQYLSTKRVPTINVLLSKKVDNLEFTTVKCNTFPRADKILMILNCQMRLDELVRYIPDLHRIIEPK